MSFVRVITRISPTNAEPDSFSKLIKPSELGNPVKVQTCYITDPRSGTQFLMETAFCLQRMKFVGQDIHKEIASECEKINGLICVSNSDSAINVLNTAAKNNEFVLSLPKHVPKERISRLLKADKSKPASQSDKSGIKVHIDLKKIRETYNVTKHVDTVKKKEDLLQSLMKYFTGSECLICGFIASKSLKHKISEHMFTHIKLGTFACDCCENKCFPTAEALFNHKINQVERKQYSCNLCNNKYKRKHFLTQHLEQEHTEFVSNSSNLNDKDYLIKQKVPTCFVCSICKHKFTSWKLIMNHRSAHSGTESYLCLFCNKSFSNTCLLRYHSHLRIIKKCHTCKICDKKFSSYHTLQDHKTMHRHKRRFACRVCGKKFNFKNSLLEHIQLLHSKV